MKHNQWTVSEMYYRVAVVCVFRCSESVEYVLCLEKLLTVQPETMTLQLNQVLDRQAIQFDCQFENKMFCEIFYQPNLITFNQKNSLRKFQKAKAIVNGISSFKTNDHGRL